VRKEQFTFDFELSPD